MNYKKKLVEWGVPLFAATGVLALGLFTAGCGGGGSDTATTGTTTGTTSGFAGVDFMGAAVELSGDYTSACYTGSTVDQTDNYNFAGATITISSTLYTSSDGSCTAPVTATETIVADIVKNTASPTGVETVASWQDGTGATVVAGPTQADGSGPIGDGVSYTPTVLTVTSISGVTSPAVGTVVEDGVVVDTTGTNVVVYRSKSVTTGTLDMIASTADPLIAQ